MVKAIWHNQIIAQTEHPLVIEGNYYFPPEDIKAEYFKPSTTHTICHWKGEASYYNIIVPDPKDPNQFQVNLDAAWYYPQPKEGSKQIVAEMNNQQGEVDFANYIAFWHGVEVVDDSK